MTPAETCEENQDLGATVSGLKLRLSNEGGE